jgi:hypothetical protein
VNSGAGKNGWTFSWDEKPFDRIIRLSKPVELRNALIDPWRDTRVTRIEVSVGESAPIAVQSDPLLDQIVTLGQAKFDENEAKRRRTTHELIIDLDFRIGGTMFALRDEELRDKLQLQGKEDVAGWQDEYMTKKPLRIKDAGKMDPARMRYLEDRGGIIEYAGFFAYRSETNTVLDLHGRYSKTKGLFATGLSAYPRPRFSLWMEFSRFDGDTLTGHVKGKLIRESESQPFRVSP